MSVHRFAGFVNPPSQMHATTPGTSRSTAPPPSSHLSLQPNARTWPFESNTREFHPFTHRNRILNSMNIVVDSTTSKLTIAIQTKGANVTIREKHKRMISTSTHSNRMQTRELLSIPRTVAMSSQPRSSSITTRSSCTCLGASSAPRPARSWRGPHTPQWSRRCSRWAARTALTSWWICRVMRQNKHGTEQCIIHAMNHSLHEYT